MREYTIKVMGQKQRKPPKRHKDKLRHIKIAVNDNQLILIRRLAYANKMTVTDYTEHLLSEALERSYVFDIPISDDYNPKGRVVQAWLSPQVYDTIFEMASERLASVRKMSYTLIRYMLIGRDVI